ncbi:MAG: hypothetical protein AVDCRST_MAG45-393, partial [uncultured Solirubrobacterales bacterium]
WLRGRAPPGGPARQVAGPARGGSAGTASGVSPCWPCWQSSSRSTRRRSSSGSPRAERPTSSAGLCTPSSASTTVWPRGRASCARSPPSSARRAVTGWCAAESEPSSSSPLRPGA